MTDVNTPLLKAYYDALKVLPYGVWEGEEPDDELAKEYLVISDVTSQDLSNFNRSKTLSQIQVSVHTWENKYNTALTANGIVEQVLALVYPSHVSTITAEGIQIITTQLTTNITQRVADVEGRKYVSRILVFSHYIYN